MCVEQRPNTHPEVDAEHDVMDRAKPLVPGEWASMRAALERRQGQLEDKVMPAKEYIEKKLAEVEANEYRAEGLTEVVSKDEVDPDTMMAVWDMKGKISMRRAGTKVEEPANAEQLRRRLTIMKNAFILVSLKHTNRPELQGDWNRAFESLKDYVLGDYVYGLTAKDSEGYTIATPPWTLVVAYEAAIRKHAAKLVNQEGKTWPVSLKEAIKDPTTKERYFTTPLALYAKRPSAAMNASSSSVAPKKGDAGQGGKKGRGRGKSGGKPPGAQRCASHTPEGDMICYRFNTVGEKCRAKKCKYKHVCGACFSTKHALPQCTAKTRADPPPDTTGAAWTKLRVLYLFSGKKRKNSLGYCLRQLAAKHELEIEVVELDIQRSRKVDFTIPAVQKQWLGRITKGEFYAVVATPPCSTYSRAPWANEAGPRPLRSHRRPRGLPWNTKAQQQKTDFGSIMADFSYEAVKRQMEHENYVFVKEQPEDLGKWSSCIYVANAPVWCLVEQIPSSRRRLCPTGLRDRQCQAHTRLDEASCGSSSSYGWGCPQLDSNGYYLGPAQTARSPIDWPEWRPFQDICGGCVASRTMSLDSRGYRGLVPPVQSRMGEGQTGGEEGWENRRQWRFREGGCDGSGSYEPKMSRWWRTTKRL